MLEVIRRVNAAAHVMSLNPVPDLSEVRVNSVLSGEAVAECGAEAGLDPIETEGPEEPHHNVTDHEEQQEGPVRVQKFLIEPDGS